MKLSSPYRQQQYGHEAIVSISVKTIRTKTIVGISATQYGHEAIVSISATAIRT
jgi:hypothetical protein